VISLLSIERKEGKQMTNSKKPYPITLKDLGGIFYINLDHRIERGEKLKKHLLDYGALEKNITRIPAIHDINNGHIGCAKSHKKALILAKKQNLENVLILEDDAFFFCDKETLNSHLTTFFTAANTDFDVLLLGGWVCESIPSTKKGLFKVIQSTRSHGYIVNSNYFDTLIEASDISIRNLEKKEFDPFENYHVQDTYDQIWHRYQEGDKWYSTWSQKGSNICKQRACFSDIFLQERKERG